MSVTQSEGSDEPGEEASTDDPGGDTDQGEHGDGVARGGTAPDRAGEDEDEGPRDEAVPPEDDGDQSDDPLDHAVPPEDDGDQSDDPLDHTVPPEDDEDDDEEGPQQIGFELADWGARERRMLDEQLGALGVPRAWEASTLVVDSSHADMVDDLIDEIEERVALDLAPGIPTVTYEVGDWPSGLEDRFIEALIENRVPHQRGYREIAVGTDDEEQVDALVETVAAAWEDEQPTDEELDGPDAQQVLSELFVSSDRLQHDASDRAGTVRFDDAAGLLDQVGLPFGFAQSDWDDITSRVATLRGLLTEAESTDDQITEAAGDLRSALRPLV